MNKTKIEYLTHTWNPVTGCLHGCPYCFAKNITRRFGEHQKGDYLLHELVEYDGTRLDLLTESDNPTSFSLGKKAVGMNPYPFGFEPTLHYYRLDEPKAVKKSARIGVVFMGDLFGDWVPHDWIEKVLLCVSECSQHTYIFLTKNPKRYREFDFPKNAWVGTSAENTKNLRARQAQMNFNLAPLRYLSLEPLLEDVAAHLTFDIWDWIILGAQTGPSSKPPNPNWIQGIIDARDMHEQETGVHIPLFLKNNLKWAEKIQEWPDQERRINGGK